MRKLSEKFGALIGFDIFVVRVVLYGTCGPIFIYEPLVASYMGRFCLICLNHGNGQSSTDTKGCLCLICHGMSSYEVAG